MALVKRGLIYSILALIAFSLAIASIATAMAHVKRTSTQPFGGTTATTDLEIQITAWKQCTEAKTTLANGQTVQNIDECEDDFGCLADKVRTIRAFSIITIILLFVAILLGIADALGKFIEPRGKMILLPLAALLIITSLISWAIIVSLWTNDCRGVAIRDIEGSGFGPSPALMIITCVLTMLMLAAALILPGLVAVATVVTTAAHGVKGDHHAKVPVDHEIAVAHQPGKDAVVRNDNVIKSDPYVE